MFTWKGEQKAGPGTYWDIKTGERVDLEEHDILPGETTTKYIRASSGVMLMFGPVLGLIYAMFLPFIGIAMTISFVGKKIYNGGKRAVRGMTDAAVQSAFFGWRPVHAYLISKRKGRKPEKGVGKTRATK
jgi:hypothetical protein